MSKKVIIVIVEGVLTPFCSRASITFITCKKKEKTVLIYGTVHRIKYKPNGFDITYQYIRNNL